MLLTTFDPANRLVADSLEAEWNNKLHTLAEAQAQYEQQTQKQRLLIDSQTREQLLSLAAEFPKKSGMIHPSNLGSGNAFSACSLRM